jgi:hypothetical protein
MPPGELFRLEDDVRVVKVDIRNKVWVGEHTGYTRLGVTHQRRFEKLGSGWLIRDRVLGNGEHDLEWFFHFAPDCPVQVAGGRVWTEYTDGPNISLIANLESLVSNFYSSWSSPTYGLRQPAPVVRFSLRAKLPIEIEFAITKQEPNLNGL